MLNNNIPFKVLGIICIKMQNPLPCNELLPSCTSIFILVFAIIIDILNHEIKNLCNLGVPIFYWMEFEIAPILPLVAKQHINLGSSLIYG